MAGGARISRLFIEPDFDRRPRVDRLGGAALLLGRCLRVHTIAAANGATLPVNERTAEDPRSALEGNINLRPPDPPRWNEPPNFQRHCDLVQRLSGWHWDWGELANLLRILAVRYAYLFGRPEVTEEDWRVLARIARDTVPPWIARSVEHLCAAPDHHATHLILACVMKLDGDDKEAATYAKDELGRLRKAGLIDWSLL